MSDRLREAARAVEQACAESYFLSDRNNLPKPLDQYDEYDTMMHPLWDALRQALEEEGDGWEAKCVRFVERFIGEIGKGEWWFHDEWSTEVMPIAAECGIAEYVPYDPAVHGERVEAEPGDEIWVWVTPPSDSVAAEACSKCGKPSTWTESTQLEESGVPLCDECAGVIYMTAEAQAEGGGA